jgi:signal recognition particle receptor subunit beta
MRLLALALTLLCADAQASFINYSSKEINCKIVYYGTTRLHDNLEYIYQRTNPEARGKKIVLKTESESTEFFDFLPLSLGEIRGFKTRFHLYTTPANPTYNASRLLILKGADGIVFVADSDPARLPATLESWESLKRNLKELGYDWKKVPLVVQVANRDRADAMPLEKIKQSLGLTSEPTIEAVVQNGVGVFDTLKAVCKLVLMELKRGASE